MHTMMSDYRHQRNRALRFVFVLTLMLVVAGCSSSPQGSTGVTVDIATPSSSGDSSGGSTNALLSGVSVSSAFPYLSAITLQISGAGVTTASINNDFNGGSFTLNAQGDALVINDTVFSINVPLETDLTFVVVAYNLSGYRLFSATATLTAAALAKPNPLLAIAMKVDIDPAIAVLATDAGCSGDADGDGYCNEYEDMFIKDCTAINPAIGMAPDIDCDGVINSQDADSDGDGVNDTLDGNIPSNDGYPTFIHANTAPQSVSLDMVTDKGVPITGNAVVVDADTGDCHSISILTAPANGTAAVLVGGVIDPTDPYSCVLYSVSYTPNSSFVGTDSFTITATDRDGASVNGTATVTVNGTNQAPVADAQTVSTNEDMSLSISLSGSDAEAGALSYTVLTAPANGTLTGSAPNLIYTPNLNYNGSDSFTFTVSDGYLDSAVATVAINIAAVNDAPVANAQSVTTSEDTPLAITLSGSDVEGSTLSYTLATPPTNGALSGSGASYTYTPNANFNGSDSFTFSVNDGALDSLPATVSLTVTPVNDPPVALDDGNRSLQRASLDSTGGEANGGSVWPAVNDNGRFVTFWSLANNLSSGDTNGVFDLFMRDTQSGQTSLLSVDSVGAEADSGQTDSALLHPAAVSIDGRYVVFESTASNLGALAGGISQLYLRDTLEKTTQLLTTCEGDGDADSYAPVMTPDATTIAFTSRATDPWPACGTAADTNGVSDVYIDSPNYGQRRVSVDAQGLITNNQANGASSQPTIDDSGVLIAFTSVATNLIAADANGAVSDIFLKNLSDESVTLVSVDSAGTQASGGNSYSPSISGDGSVIAFVSEATNLVSGDNNGVADIFVHDIATGQTERVSVDSSNNEANGASSRPVISKDGRYVLFESLASNLDAGDTNGVGDLFIHDRVLGETYLMSSDASGIPANASTAMAAFSGDGRYVAFASDANNLVAADKNAVSDVINMNLTDIATSSAIAVTTPNVLLNDTDVDNDPLSVLSNSPASSGIVLNNGDGTFSYTPNNGFVGVDRFLYTVSDGAGGSDTAYVNLAVGASNYTPQGVSDTATTTAPNPVTINVLANDFDLDNGTLMVGSADTTSYWGGTVVLNADNTITFTPGTSQTPPYTDSFSYWVTDGMAVGNTTTVTVNVQ